ncbi:hypothetical protein ACFYR1_44785 [Streptomyces canus]|uniref:hypothetical protein n=1 Tax=Streptomyces canus TaxID=58343 RepID=UPI00367C2758
MAGIIRLYRRATAAVLLCVGVLAVLVAAHVVWVRAAEDAYETRVAGQKTDDDGTDDKAKAEAEATKRYERGNEHGRSGSTTVRIVRNSGAGGIVWRATARHRVKMRADDPLAEDLRSERVSLDDWIPFFFDFMSTGRHAPCAGSAFEPDADGGGVEQDGPNMSVYAVGESAASWRGAGTGCTTSLQVTVKDGELGKNAMYDQWTLTIDAPRYIAVGIDGGTVLRQTARRAELLLPARNGVTIHLRIAGSTETPERTNGVALASVLQNDKSTWREATALLVAVLAVTRFWVLPSLRSWAPPVTQVRWSAAAAVAGVLTAATLAYALETSSNAFGPRWVYGGNGMPLVAWWWVLLPFLVGVFLIRATTDRPPGTQDLLILALVPGIGPLVAVIVMMTAGSMVMPLMLVIASGAAAALLAWALLGGALGRAGKRWAATAVTGFWLLAVTLGPGTGLVDDLGTLADWTTVNGIVGACLGWGWPAVLWPVLISLGWGRRAYAHVLMAWVVLAAAPQLSDPPYYWYQQTQTSWAIGIYSTFAANRPLVALQTVVIVSALLFLSHHGRTRGEWPPHFRAVVVGLGIAAVATTVTQVGLSLFDDNLERRGRYLAVVVAAAGFAALLPPAAGKRAIRLHAVTPRAHTRRMHALLKDQTLAASRREFLSASQMALANGDLTARQWSARWRALGAQDRAPRHSAELRLAALGSSGGRDAWRNGRAAGILLTAVSLPWLLYTLPPLLSDSYSNGDLIGVWTYALRWLLYGFIYGYAYSWLRGGSPLGKAMCLLGVVLPAELFQLFYRDLAPGDFGILTLLTTGDCLAAFLVLGLYWEARLVRAAGLRWGQIRNFRSLSAVAVPATTVLVAVATALATAMVGVWVSPDTGPVSDVPNGQPSATAPQAPEP